MRNYDLSLLGGGLKSFSGGRNKNMRAATEKEYVHVWDCLCWGSYFTSVCVWNRERESVCVCVCVKRELEKDFKGMRLNKGMLNREKKNTE